jgi:exodeoxyribonuclease-5
LSRNNWIDDDGLIVELVRQLSDDPLQTSHSRPASICMAGFDRISPALQALLELLKSSNVSITQASGNSSAGTIMTTSNFDQAAELRAAGAWARKQLLGDPDIRVAIICPELETNASQVLRLVREGFVPGWQVSSTQHRDAVDVSYGRPLADYPAIRVALMLLRWVHDGLRSREVSILLRSESIEAGSSADRCRLEQKLRRIPDRLWSPEDLLGVLSSSADDPGGNAWSKIVGNIAKTKKHYREKASPAQWAERFDQVLTESGWPGARSPGSDEFQLLNRWRDLLNEFSGLQHVEPALGFAAAVARLTQLASDSIFQPEADHDVLPVLGVLEAAGMEFDKIWVSAFDTRHWPSSGNPLAFVSRQLQKDYGMPHATPQDTLEFSRHELKRLTHSASEVVLSWALFEGDVPLQVSPLLENLAVTGDANADDPGWYASTMSDSDLLNLVSEDPVPPVGNDEVVTGGAYTVQRQSSDPFSGFACGRLRVNDLQSFQAGLPARIRGSAIHSALSDLYSGHPSQIDLREWSESDWRKRAAQSARKSLRHLERSADTALLRIIEMERQRIEGIIFSLANEEKLRENFRVAMTEQMLEYSGHGIRLSLRVDRVDIMDDESALIIDYKTGTEKGLTNRNDELYDLQLMVYASALQKEYAIGGIGIVNLDTRKISFKTAVKDEKWDERYARWGADTDAAIQAISRGDASVNMSLKSDQARPLSILSRIEELRRGR